MEISLISSSYYYNYCSIIVHYLNAAIILLIHICHMLSGELFCHIVLTSDNTKSTHTHIQEKYCSVTLHN